MKFRDFEVGMVLRHPPIVVTREEMLAYAKAYDPQPFHVDEEAAKASRWGGLIGSGWLTCGLAMRMACAVALNGSESFGSPGLDRVRWPHPVRPGDALRFEGTVDSKRVSSTRSDLGILRWTWRLFNQHDEMVLELEATNMFELQEDAAD